jgi:hypothetical protein
MTIAKTEVDRQSISVLPLGRLHSHNVCAYCGADANETELKWTVLAMTRAEAVVCAEFADCLRRRTRLAA